jgi:hypothetical protein
MKCIRCNISLEEYHPCGPFCDKCFYTCPICNEYDPDSFRYRIIRNAGTHHEVAEVVCVKCGNEWKRNRYREEMSIVLSSGLVIC